MSASTLKVVLVGVGGFGAHMLDACQHCENIELVGLSDRNPAAMEQAAADYDVPGYIDNRSLLVETRPDAAFLAVPPTAAPELIARCAELGIHVWKEQPLARNLDEGVAMVQAMERAKLLFAVGTQWRFCDGYHAAAALRPRLGQVFLGRAHYLFNWGPNLGWRGDRESAGGGALLELGYHPLDLLTWLHGLPEQVFGVHACGNRPDSTGPGGQPLPPYDTDDTAAAVLRYLDGAMATVVACRVSGPVSDELVLHGRHGSLTANTERCTLRGPDGEVLECVQADSIHPAEPFRRQARAFAQAVLVGTQRYDCSARENLLTLATIDAIYLAHQTAHPESPAQLLVPHRLKPRDCLTLRPAAETHDTPPPPPTPDDA